MDENLIGYLLNALDAETHAAVEQHLAESPDARQRLELLRQALSPLESDREAPPAPAGLAERTLAFVARPPEPARRLVLPSGGGAGGRGGWRAVDVLVAASVLAVASLMVAPAILRARHQAQVLACADNLRGWGEAATTYASDHGGELPRPAKRGGMANAGVVVPVLHHSRRPAQPMNVTCPANDHGQKVEIPSPRELEDCYNCDRTKYTNQCKKMGGCYGYHCGYVENGRFKPLCRKTLGDNVAVMGDHAPASPEINTQSNSPNHNSQGQNVLYLGGHVRFVNSRLIGDDDIFLNRAGQVGVGLGKNDIVLAASETPVAAADDD